MPRIKKPDTLGLATKAVEKVPRVRKAMVRGQSLASHLGQGRFRPKKRLLVPAVEPVRTPVKAMRWKTSPRVGRGQARHQIRPPRGVSTAVNRNSQTTQVSMIPRLRPGILVPKRVVRMTT